MKRIIYFIFLLSIIGVTYYYRNNIITFYIKNFTNYVSKPDKLTNNEYSNNNSYQYVQLTDDFYVKNKKDIMNVYYTIINSGMDKFTFICDESYKNCLNDVDEVSNNQKMLTYINNFVPVYNSFKNIETEFNNLGKVSVKIKHDYTKEEIELLNNKVEEIIANVIDIDMKDEAKIKAIHDYIIKNTKYDKEKADKKVNKYKSDIAYGALIEGYAICGGYSDSMKLFLDKFNIPNIKISSENHIWNAVKLDGKWYHLDLTWDDPVTSTGEDIIEYNYFLITNEELNNQEKEQHTIDYNIYKELKEA